jgi:hypothetical protein
LSSMRSHRPKIKPAQAPPPANVRSLQLTAFRALRLYRRTANNRVFAARLARRLRAGFSPAPVERLIQPLYPQRISVTGLGGFFVCFSTGRPTNCFGLFTVNFRTLTPNAIRLRIMARALIPLYRRIARNRVYAARIVRAINANNRIALSRIIRETVVSPRLARVEIVRDQPDPSFEPDIGFDVIFRFGNASYRATIG